MSEHTTSIAHDDVAVQVGSAGRGFETPEGLRTLLNRLNESGPGSWRADREAAELMRYAAFRYRRLARKYEMDAWEVASTAFEVMLARSQSVGGRYARGTDYLQGRDSGCWAVDGDQSGASHEQDRRVP
jgi:hypothetical protein